MEQDKILFIIDKSFYSSPSSGILEDFLNLNFSLPLKNDSLTAVLQLLSD